jgi:hypothetical protein
MYHDGLNGERIRHARDCCEPPQVILRWMPYPVFTDVLEPRQRKDTMTFCFLSSHEVKAGLEKSPRSRGIVDRG